MDRFSGTKLIEFQDFSLIPLPLKGQGEIELHYSDEEFVLPDSEMKIINPMWEELLSEKGDKLLHDGPMVRLNSIDIVNGIPVLKMQNTSYKIFCCSNLRDPRPPAEQCANGTGICIVIVTGDNKIIVGKRTGRVFQYPNCYHVIGGNMEPDNHRNENNIPDPFVSIRKEVNEEIGVDIPVDRIKLIGFGRDRKTNKPEILFYSKITEVTDQIMADGIEHRNFEFIENNPETIKEF